ncbi:hypothetical protein MMC31_004194 [Peltigera leucophlebia]|nr:hypothetical protein [Peltigera leucophlebia]
MVKIPDVHGEAQRYHLRRFFACLAQAVSCLNDLNIRHKDIKPTNILVDSFGNVLLADFEILLKAPDKAHLITQSNTNRSYEYCSLEVIAKRKRYPSSDVFSLGAVFAEMTTVVLNRQLTEFRKFRESRDGDKSFHRNLDKVERWMELLAKPLDGEEEDGRRDEMIKAIPTILGILAYKRNAPRGTDSGIDRPAVSSLWESFQNVSSYICHDCDPRQPSPWRHEPLPEEKSDLDWSRYFQNLSEESLHNSLKERETNTPTGSWSRPTNSHNDRQAPEERKTEILYNPQTRTFKMVARAEIEGHLALLLGIP